LTRRLADTVTPDTLPLWAYAIIDGYKRLLSEGYSDEQAQRIVTDELRKYFNGES
jgi:hypothetical protein